MHAGAAFPHLETLYHDGLVPGVFQVFVEEVAHAEFHEAVVGAVGAGVLVAVGDFLVDDEGDEVLGVVDEAQNRGGSDARAELFPQHFTGGKRDARNVQCPAELLGHKRLLSRGDIQIELGLLAVADENGLHHRTLQSFGNEDAVFHRAAVIGIYAAEGNLQLLQGFVDMLLCFCFKLRRRRGHLFADKKAHSLCFFRAAKVQN